MIVSPRLLLSMDSRSTCNHYTMYEVYKTLLNTECLERSDMLQGRAMG